MDVLQLLLKQTIQDGVGDINQEVWEELVGALVNYVKQFSVSGRLHTLNDMPVRHWRLYSKAVITGMLLMGVRQNERMNSRWKRIYLVYELS